MAGRKPAPFPLRFSFTFKAALLLALLLGLESERGAGAAQPSSEAGGRLGRLISLSQREAGGRLLLGKRLSYHEAQHFYFPRLLSTLLTEITAVK